MTSTAGVPASFMSQAERSDTLCDFDTAIARSAFNLERESDFGHDFDEISASRSNF